MEKSSVRLRAVLTLVVVSLVAAYGMQAYLAIYMNKEWESILGRLGLFSAIVVTAIGVAGFVLWRSLRPLSEACDRIAGGQTLTEAQRQEARRATNRVFPVVLTVEVLGFFLAPVVTIVIYSVTGRVQYGPMEIPLILAFNLSIGAMAALQIILLLENQFRKPLEDLAYHEVQPKSRPSSLRTRILLASLASTVWACSAFAGAALGYLHHGVLDQPGFFDQFGLELGLLALICLGWGFGLTATIAGSVTHRLRSVTSRIEEIAAGGGDLVKRLTLARDDDIGALAGAFNHFLATLETLIGQTRGLATKVQGSAQALAGSASSAGHSVAQLEQAQRAMKGDAEGQFQEAGRTREVIEQMAGSIGAVADRVAKQLGHVEHSAAAVAEMAANIASVTGTAEKADQVATRLRAHSDEGDTALKDMLGAIRQLEETSKAVGAIVGSISKIAAQTNLLAMNAAIEAAHAGDSGAGFAVVADEVRTLAESSGRSAKEIVALIRTMGDRIATGQALADRAGASFERIREGVADTSTLVGTIAASMAEQNAAAGDILASVQDLTEATQAIRTLSDDQRHQSTTVREATHRIVAASERILGAVQQEAQDTAVLAQVVELVRTEAQGNQAATQDLAASVSRFRVREPGTMVH